MGGWDLGIGRWEVSLPHPGVFKQLFLRKGWLVTLLWEQALPSLPSLSASRPLPPLICRPPGGQEAGEDHCWPFFHQPHGAVETVSSLLWGSEVYKSSMHRLWLVGT